MIGMITTSDMVSEYDLLHEEKDRLNSLFPV